MANSANPNEPKTPTSPPTFPTREEQIQKWEKASGKKLDDFLTTELARLAPVITLRSSQGNSFDIPMTEVSRVMRELAGAAQGNRAAIIHV
jgi:hypothetical protein